MEQLKGVYNEQELVIDRIITAETNHVIHGLLLLNLDDFYKVNEALGFEKGDHILELVNDKVQKFFKGTDIVSKLKWGEYAVLIQNPKTVNDIEKIAEKVLKSIASIDAEGVNITASIGIAVYPFHGKNYEDLKLCAYQALTRAKTNGKNCCRVYESALTKARFSNYLFEGDYDDFDYRNLQESAWDKYLMDVSLQLFHYDSNVYASMNSLMEIFCLYHGYSRAFIVSNFEHSVYEKKNLEFTLPGFEQPSNEIADILKNDLVIRLHEEYGDYGLVRLDKPSVDPEIMTYMHDTESTELLYFAIKYHDEFSGAIVFVNAEASYTKVDGLQLRKLANQITSIVNYSFLSKLYRASKETLSKIEMFESMGANVYLIDSKNHVIDYMNSNAIDESGNIFIGKKCHQVLRNCDGICDDCPLKQMDVDDVRANARIEYFNYSANKWSVNLYSWVSGRDNKGKALLISIDMENVFDSINQ